MQGENIIRRIVDEIRRNAGNIGFKFTVMHLATRIGATFEEVGRAFDELAKFGYLKEPTVGSIWTREPKFISESTDDILKAIRDLKEREAILRREKELASTSAEGKGGKEPMPAKHDKNSRNARELILEAIEAAEGKGITIALIQEKTRLSYPTAATHIGNLVASGLLKPGEKRGKANTWNATKNGSGFSGGKVSINEDGNSGENTLSIFKDGIELLEKAAQMREDADAVYKAGIARIKEILPKLKGITSFIESFKNVRL